MKRCLTDRTLRIKKYAAGCLLVLLSTLPLAVSADTTTDYQSQMASLLQQIISLQKTIIESLTSQISQLQQQIAQVPVQNTSHLCTPITPPSCATSLTPSYDSYNCVVGYTCANGNASTAATPAPTATLTASPTSITQGGSATLTWAATNADSCIGTGFTVSGTSGTVTVSPTAATTYALTCFNSTGNVVASATIAVASLASCIFNNQTIADGQSVTAYQSASVASGQQCVGQSRVCHNGVLDGSYAYATCAVSSSQVTSNPSPSCSTFTLGHLSETSCMVNPNPSCTIENTPLGHYCGGYCLSSAAGVITTYNAIWTYPSCGPLAE